MIWAVPHERLLSSPDVRVAVSVSGGKDSTAVALLLREQGVPFEAVFADTGWEADVTYRYLDEVLEPLFGPIVRVRASILLPPDLEEDAARIEAMLGRTSPMVRRILQHLTFPRRTMRWCTQELKLAPLRDHHQQLAAQGMTVVVAVGVRADESEKRAAAQEWDIGEPLDAIVWRPIVRWTLDDVIAMLRRHGVAPNPLYLRGASRVGCWPCIHASKVEYLLVGQDQRRVAALRELEAVVARRWSAQDHPPHHRPPTWHHGWPDGNGPLPLMPPIDEVILWSRRQRQSDQITMFRDHELAAASCAAWGVCS